MDAKDQSREKSELGDVGAGVAAGSQADRTDVLQRVQRLLRPEPTPVSAWYSAAVGMRSPWAALEEVAGHELERPDALGQVSPARSTEVMAPSPPLELHPAPTTGVIDCASLARGVPSILPERDRRMQKTVSIRPREVLDGGFGAPLTCSSRLLVVGRRAPVPVAPDIIRFDDAAAEASIDFLGGKVSGLVEMTRAGLHVPPGFAVTTAAHAWLMNVPSVRALLQAWPRAATTTTSSS